MLISQDKMTLVKKVQELEKQVNNLEHILDQFKHQDSYHEWRG